MVNPAKIPLVLVACGSCIFNTSNATVSPITYLHLRMFEMALDWVNDASQSHNFELLGGYFSPVSDDYKKADLAHFTHRVNMSQIAISDSHWLMVDPWEASQATFVRTVSVLDHFEKQLAGRVVDEEGVARDVRIMLLAGGDLSIMEN